MVRWLVSVLRHFDLSNGSVAKDGDFDLEKFVVEVRLELIFYSFPVAHLPSAFKS
jgi:hypothetical protein